MAAYASLVSIMHIIDQIEHHPSPPISMDKKQVESLTDIVMFLQEFLEGYKSPFADGDEADPLEMRIADAVYAAEDVIESHIVDQIRPVVLVLYEALRNMIENMDLIVAVKERKLLRQLFGPSTSTDFYQTVRDLIEDIQLIEERVIKDMDVITVVKGRLQQQQVSASAADLYKNVVKVIEHMDLIKNEVMVIFKFKDQLQRQVSTYAHSSTYANIVDVREDMDLDLIKKDMMEIIAVKDQLQIQVAEASLGSSTSTELHESLKKVIEDMDLIKKEVMEIVALEDQQVSSSAGSLRSESSLSRLNNATMVGLDDVMLQLMEKLVYGEHNRQVIPITGMGGIGKTTLAINVYAHPSISHHFDICAWVTISQQYDTKELLCEILCQANKQRLSEMSEGEIGLSLHKCLSQRRYLIVLDDMWSIEAWEKIQRYFPNNSNGSRIMVTTRLSILGSQLNNTHSLEMKFMDEESSWNIFCKIVFGGESCPFELEKIGKKICESCRGLPLSIVLVGGLLEKLQPTEECWEAIRRSLYSLVNLEDDKYCLKILKLSYNHLPINLKLCFMYLGMFKEDSEIRVSTLIKLWISEGFLRPVSGKSLERVAKEYIDELVGRNLILAHKFGKTGSMKYFKIHDLLRDLCLREVEKERFYHVVGQYSPQGTCNQRRIVILGSTSEVEVVDAIKSRPYARTCISDGERVQSLSYLRLLRTLKTHNNKDVYRQEYFLRNLFELVNLRLLIVHSEWKSTQLPSSINLLWSLQTLIVDSYENIDAPVEIWNMPQLRHVHFYGFGINVNESGALHLPDPPSDNIVIMENLQTLKGVINFKCDEMMVRRIPNIKKLGLIYRDQHDGTESCDDGYCLHNIERLQKLESIHCKGNIGDADSLQKLTFPQSLKSLTLSMPGGRMEDILEKVSTLPHLQKLQLISGDFSTGKWETFEGQFLSLKYLSLYRCHRLEWWMMESSHFPCLENLQLNSIDLKEFPAELGEIPTLKYVKLDNCSKSEMVKSAKRMVEEQEELHGEDQLSFQVEVWLSYMYYDEDDELLSLESPNFQINVLP